MDTQYSVLDYSNPATDTVYEILSIYIIFMGKVTCRKCLSKSGGKMLQRENVGFLAAWQRTIIHIPFGWMENEAIGNSISFFLKKK